MILEIIRFKEIQDRTLGSFNLIDDDKVILSGYTCEPAGPDTIESGKDRRIPQGLYNVTWHQSPKFNRLLPLLYNEIVSKSRYILIHSGNNGSHTQGCILLGETYDDGGVYNSRETLNKLLSLIKDQSLEIIIKNKLGE